MPRTFLLCLLLCLAACAALKPPPPKEYPELQAEVEAGSAAIRTFRADPGNAPLSTLLANCTGIAVFPAITRASFILGMGSGKGLVASRDPAAGFSDPAFCSLALASAGLQAGFSQTRLLLVFMTDKALKNVLGNNLVLGGELSWAAGPRGASARLDSLTAFPDIYAYTVTDGLYAGAALDGSVLTARESSDRHYYGESATPRTILVARTTTKPAAAVFRQALEE